MDPRGLQQQGLIGAQQAACGANREAAGRAQQLTQGLGMGQYYGASNVGQINAAQVRGPRTIGQIREEARERLKSRVDASEGKAIGKAMASHVETVARAMFEADGNVIVFVMHKAEVTPATRYTVDGEQRYHRAMTIAWGRDENGWRTEHMATAERMKGILAGRK